MKIHFTDEAISTVEAKKAQAAAHDYLYSIAMRAFCATHEFRQERDPRKNSESFSLLLKSTPGASLPG
jgi:hypothetical protein